MTARGLEAARTFSSDVIVYLKKSKTLREIGALIGRSESFVSLVSKGKRSLTIEHLIALEHALGKSLPLLMLEVSAESLSRRDRQQYEALRQILEKAEHLWVSAAARKRAESR